MASGYVHCRFLRISLLSVYFQINEPKHEVNFILTGSCVRKKGGEGVQAMRTRWGLPYSSTFEEHILVAVGTSDDGVTAIMG